MCQPQRLLGAAPISLGDVDAVLSDDLFLAAENFRGRARRREPAHDFRADGNQAVSAFQLRDDRIRQRHGPAVVTAGNAEQACADENIHACFPRASPRQKRNSTAAQMSTAVMMTVSFAVRSAEEGVPSDEPSIPAAAGTVCVSVVSASAVVSGGKTSEEVSGTSVVVSAAVSDVVSAAVVSCGATTADEPSPPAAVLSSGVRTVAFR